MNFVKSLNLFGIEAKEIPCITGGGAPTAETAGAVGSLYMDILNGKLYKCTAANETGYTWVEVADNGNGSGGGISVVSTNVWYDGGIKKTSVTLRLPDGSTVVVGEGKNGTDGKDGAGIYLWDFSAEPWDTDEDGNNMYQFVDVPTPNGVKIAHGDMLMDSYGNVYLVEGVNMVAFKPVFKFCLSSGNVDLTGVVKSVNGQTPDENGNVEVKTVEVTDEQIAKAFDAYLEEHPVTIVFDDLEEYEAFTVVTDSGEVVDPENPGEDDGESDTELTHQSYVGYGEDLMLQYDAIQQYALGKPTSGGSFNDVSGNDFPTDDNNTKYYTSHPTYISPDDGGNCSACDCGDQTLLGTLNEANQITVEFVGQRINSSTTVQDVVCLQPNQNTALIYNDGTMKPLGASNKYGTASLDCTAIKHNSVTFNGSEWKMYSEGELVATYASNTAINCTAIGCLGYRGWARSNPMYFNTMRIYKRALTASEIKTNYNIDVARFGTVNVEVTA